MEKPTNKEFDNCKEYMIMRYGWAYWNPTTKKLHEFTIDGTFIKTADCPRCPSQHKPYIQGIKDYRIYLLGRNGKLLKNLPSNEDI